MDLKSRIISIISVPPLNFKEEKEEKEVHLA